MNDVLVKKALEKVHNRNVLVNLVSQRVRQLNRGGGGRPLVSETNRTEQSENLERTAHEASTLSRDLPRARGFLIGEPWQLSDFNQAIWAPSGRNTLTNPQARRLVPCKMPGSAVSRRADCGNMTEKGLAAPSAKAHKALMCQMFGSTRHGGMFPAKARKHG